MKTLCFAVAGLFGTIAIVALVATIVASSSWDDLFHGFVGFGTMLAIAVFAAVVGMAAKELGEK